MSLALLNERIGVINDLLTTVNLLVWDSRTMMPPGGAAARGRQIATLTRLARDLACDDEMLRRLEAAERAVAVAGADETNRAAVRQVREAAEAHRRMPPDLIERRALLQAAATSAWAAARESGAFATFEPFLAETMVVARAQADALGWRDHPYDALLGFYEPGETLASLRRLFDTLRQGLKPILDAARARPKPRGVLSGDFPMDRQLALCSRLAAAVGYDFGRGRLDPTIHPFEISFTREDVRITTRAKPRHIGQSIFGTLHESGHGLYEQNIDPAFTRTVFATDLLGLYAVGGTSYGAHESQSRLFENHVGRSEAFWHRHYPALVETVPAFAEIPLTEFLAAVTRVEPGLIRTDADEVTYDFHVMVRVEIEAALIGGDLAARDVPEVWRQRMREYLDLEVPNDRDGCLQDVHWSAGLVGSFCTYTVGNIMAAQLFETACRQPGVGEALERADVAPLSDWLRDKVWRHGRRYRRDEILDAATGRALDPAPYLRHLARRYGSGDAHRAA
ncbi:MAG TPA: carboxypeptidase M32 [Dongiaceae bacterium]|nr:carboxypeptidase M32 [Dongiaceae bacterium]